jgi:hypothetical protein
MSKIILSIDEARHLIREADVLLFKGNGIFSGLVKKAGEGSYSHVALASWYNGSRDSSLLEAVEFKEGKGGRTVNLLSAYKSHLENELIDVYRVTKPIYKTFYNTESKKVEKLAVDFNAKGITRCMRNLTGLPYGWKRIWWIAKNKMIGLRWFMNIDHMDNDNSNIDLSKIYPVCSTAVAACFSKYGYDLTKNRADEFMEPSDIARSAILSYLFTLKA